ncbi:hypothetical protein [Photobacterium sp. 53610]|uniref:hypothetical protein n=1 Tax=Photobacterium sp. 53610 TaxID=3102789 RepID=UPI002ED7C4C6
MRFGLKISFFKFMFICVLQLLSTGIAVASTVNITGVYSSLNLHQESGDVIGIELIISESYSGKYFVSFQASEGAPRIPVVSELTVHENEITFQVKEENGYQGSFQGTVSQNELKGSFVEGQLSPSGDQMIVLPRTQSYWQ